MSRCDVDGGGVAVNSTVSRCDIDGGGVAVNSTVQIEDVHLFACKEQSAINHNSAMRNDRDKTYNQ